MQGNQQESAMGKLGTNVNILKALRFLICRRRIYVCVYLLATSASS